MLVGDGWHLRRLRLWLRTLLGGVRVDAAVLAGLPLLPVVADGPDLPERVPTSEDPVLIDGPRAGSGQTTNWNRIAHVAQHQPIVLAGGLNPENVAQAMAAVQPIGVDVSSGVERRHGLKDPQRIHAFVRAVRQAAHALEIA